MCRYGQVQQAGGAQRLRNRLEKGVVFGHVLQDVKNSDGIQRTCRETGVGKGRLQDPVHAAAARISRPGGIGFQGKSRQTRILKRFRDSTVPRADIENVAARRQAGQ